MRWTSFSRSIGSAVGADSLCACRRGSSRRCAGVPAPRVRAPAANLGRAYTVRCPLLNNTTLGGGSLGSRVDEGRSEVRELM